MSDKLKKLTKMVHLNQFQDMPSLTAKRLRYETAFMLPLMRETRYLDILDVRRFIPQQRPGNHQDLSNCLVASLKTAQRPMNANY